MHCVFVIHGPPRRCALRHRETATRLKAQSCTSAECPEAVGYEVLGLQIVRNGGSQLTRQYQRLLVTDMDGVELNGQEIKCVFVLIVAQEYTTCVFHCVRVGGYFREQMAILREAEMGKPHQGELRARF
jgi:hypothetical protein